MSILFLNVSTEEAVKRLQLLIMEGYKLKDDISADYNLVRDESGLIEMQLPEWSLKYQEWQKKVLLDLEAIYVTPINAYIVRDEHSSLVKTGIPSRLSNIFMDMQVKLTKLNEYLMFILQRIDGKITINGDIVLRDKIEVTGEDNKIVTKN